MNGNNWQQSDDDNEDSFQQATDTDGDQLDQDIAEYRANQENRQRHNPDWWGTRHPYPDIGDPDREFIYARNVPISDEEVDDAVTAYNKVATNQGTEEFNTLGVSMRPTTPPMERAKKQVEGLVEQGCEVTAALRDEIYEKLTRDSGLIAALQEYCRNGDDVPNAHANELLKMVDRLKALFAEEMAKSSRQLQDLSDNFDNYKKSKGEQVEMLEEKFSESETKLAEAKDKLESKQSELDKIQQQGGMDSTKQANGHSQSEDKVARLLKEKAMLQSKIVMYEAGKTRKEVESVAGDEFRVSDEHTADLIAAEDRAKTADRDRQAGNHFHQEFYEVMKEKVKSWEAKATTADDESNQYGAMSSDAVRLLHEVARDLDGMVLEFQKGWPPAYEAFNSGQIQQDSVTKDALERSSKGLKEKYEENQQDIRKLARQETELMERLEDVNRLIKEKEEKTQELNKSIKKLEEAEEQLQSLRAKANAGRPASSPPEDLKKLREDLNNHKDWLVESHDENILLQNANEALTGQVKELERRKEELEKQHKENQNEIKKLQTERIHLIEENTGLRRERDDLRADIKKVGGEKEELEKEKKQLESERATNQTELKRLQNEKDKLEKLRQDDPQRLNECIEAEQKKTGNLQVDAKKLDDLRKEVAQLESQHATDQGNLEKARADNRGLTKERDDLKQSLEKKLEEAKCLWQEKKQMQVDCKEQKQRLQRNIDNLQKSHDAKEQEVEELRQQGESNWLSADALIRAAARAVRTAGRPDDDQTPTLGGGEMSLMDRINYLNLSVFLRTRNYVELALREGCNRLANMLIHDANKWAEQCREDLSKMNPSVNNQVRASMYVLNGLKRVMVAKDMNEINKGAREFKYGQKLLTREDADRATFGQLIDLAGSLVEWLDRLNISHGNPEMRRGLQADKVSWRKNMEFVVRRRAKLQSGLRNDPNLKASVLRRTGLHSPLTPERWDDDVCLEEDLGDDEAVSRGRGSEYGK
ncbi:Hypothetical protein NCS54_00677700 [Fusarium falciforme]|uniref:Hypothetical protein n=1 Tax=Fusarium falciforme TaxID=195108 RepID=UPI0023010EB8|nr:Hypothetical protein NCS54_00677700 [Fusarium falciforme]WAO89388.1 Hypothetical protein NCS54_00677700 [Fusarium falciforme]